VSLKKALLHELRLAVPLFMQSLNTGRLCGDSKEVVRETLSLFFYLASARFG
jgi:hypothetical protein